MAYQVNKTDGTLLAIVEDGTTNTTASSIGLIGKGKANYGETLNENLVWMMEHFAAVTPPSNPLIGQLWYDITSTVKTLKVYKSTGWVPLVDENFSSSTISTGTSLPASSDVIGDLFWNTSAKELHVWDAPGAWLQIFPPPSETISRIQNPGNTEFVDTDLSAGEVIIGAGGTPALEINSTEITINNNLVLDQGIEVQGVGVYTRQQYFDASQPSSTLTDSSSISWNLNVAQVANVTLGGNRTLANPSNMKNGGVYILIVKQDGTGSRVLSYGSAYKFPDGNFPTLTTDPNAVDILTFVSDGVSMFGSALLDLR